MLVLKRKEGQWVEITHKSGDVIRVRTCNIDSNHLDLVFDGDRDEFEIQRPERGRKPATIERPKV